MFSEWLKLPALSVCVLLITAAVATAQTGAAMLEKPWADRQTRYEIDGQAIWFDSADVEGTSTDLDLSRFDSAGRMRYPLNEGDDELSFGYDATYLDLSTADPMLPERLVDVSGSFGWTRQLDQGRQIGVAGGVGYAGNTPFTKGDATYFMGHIMFVQPLDRRSKLTFTLAYNGNRAIWPDIPLPLVSYSRRVSDEFSYTIGVPFSTFRWRPTQQFTLSGNYLPAYNFEVRADYELTERFGVFGQLDNTTDAFVVDGNENRRLFFEQSRLEAGVRYQADDQVALVLAGGYAFDQEFERGWDVRDTDTVRDIDDTPFLRGQIKLTF